MTEQKKTRTILSITDNFRLCQYLVNNPPVAGESLRDILTRATGAAGVEKVATLNEFHIRTRLDEFNLPLIPGSGPASSELADLRERVKRLDEWAAAQETFVTGLVERLAKAESAIAAHKLAIQGISNGNGYKNGWPIGDPRKDDRYTLVGAQL